MLISEKTTGSMEIGFASREAYPIIRQLEYITVKKGWHRMFINKARGTNLGSFWIPPPWSLKWMNQVSTVQWLFCYHRKCAGSFKSTGPDQTWQVEQKPGGRGRGREWATLGVHPLSWLLSSNRLEKVPFVSVPHTSSNRLLLSNQDKGCTPSVAHSLPLPLGPALLNLWTMMHTHTGGLRTIEITMMRAQTVELWRYPSPRNVFGVIFTTRYLL